MWNVTQPNFIGDLDLPSAFEITEFSQGALKSFGKYLQNLYVKEVPYAVLNINSFGGDCAVMQGMLSLMESYRKKGIKFCGVVSGFAFSAGAVIFLFCDNGFRFMGNNATLMIHDSQSGHPQDRVSSMKKYADFIHAQDELLNEKLSLHLKKPKKWLTNELSKRNLDDWYITASEVKELKLAEIGLPEFNVVVTTEFEITY